MGGFFKLHNMKTAMSLALARIELKKYISTDSIHWEMFKNDCMEKEKEQIIDAYNQADLEGYFQKTYPKYAEEYYNKTYNNGTK